MKRRSLPGLGCAVLAAVSLSVLVGCSDSDSRSADGPLPLPGVALPHVENHEDLQDLTEEQLAVFIGMETSEAAAVAREHGFTLLVSGPETGFIGAGLCHCVFAVADEDGILIEIES